MQEASKDNKFGSIINAFKKMVFNDVPANDKPAQTNNNAEQATVKAQELPKEEPIIAPVTPVTQDAAEERSIDERELVQKIYQLFESINKPGLDFFELWNASEAMGGATPVNIQNAFTTLKVLGLTKEMVLQTGKQYLVEIDQKINADIKSKQQEKNQLVLQLQQEKASLQKKESDLEKQILELKKALTDTQTALEQVDGKFTKPIFVLDDKMRVGSSALKIVTDEIGAVLNTVEKSIQ